MLRSAGREVTVADSLISALFSVFVHAEGSSLKSVKAVCPAAMALIERIDKLYDKPMPASTNWF